MQQLYYLNKIAETYKFLKTPNLDKLYLEPKYLLHPERRNKYASKERKNINCWRNLFPC